MPQVSSVRLACWFSSLRKCEHRVTGLLCLFSSMNVCSRSCFPHGDWGRDKTRKHTPPTPQKVRSTMREEKGREHIIHIHTYIHSYNMTYVCMYVVEIDMSPLFRQNCGQRCAVQVLNCETVQGRSSKPQHTTPHVFLFGQTTSSSCFYVAKFL